MNEKQTKHWSRQEVASKLAELEAYVRLNPETTPSQLAEELGVPRTTLQHWVKRKEEIDADPQIRDFFCSPTGLAFLHRLVIGAQFTLVMLSGGSPRKVAQFLELTGLDRFVGSSYGTQRAVSLQMENAIIAFGKQERVRLATGMKKKKIAACQDETFVPDVCLVATLVSSNFILCEQYTPDRKAVTWTKAMKHSLDGLPVEIIQSTSDEAAAIKSHVKNELKAHHSPDLFHVQQEIVKATALTLARKVKQANQELEKVRREAQKLKIKYMLQSEPAQDQAQIQTPTQLPALLSTQAQIQTPTQLPALLSTQAQLQKQARLPALVSPQVSPPLPAQVLLSTQATEPISAPAQVPVSVQAVAEVPTAVRVQVPAQLLTQAPVPAQVVADVPTAIPVQVPAHMLTQAPVPAQAVVDALTTMPVQVPAHMLTQASMPAQAVVDALTTMPIQVPAQMLAQAPIPAQAVAEAPTAVQAQIQTLEATKGLVHAQGTIQAGNKVKLDPQAELQKINALEKKAVLNLQKAEIWQREAKQAIGKIKQSYHPYDLQTGQAREAKIVKKSIEEQFNKLEQIAEEAELSNSSIKRIEKAKRVLAQMVATITFFFLTIRANVLALELDEGSQQVVLEQLIPAIYLSIVSRKSNNRQEVQELEERSRLMLASVNGATSPFIHYSFEKRQEIEAVAIECAHLFQRSSSCVEGRNGYLSLWQHSWHHISERKLAALTTVHNYFTKRPDGTTPAERFFDQKPEDLFSWLLEHVDLPARPAAKRPLPSAEPFLKLPP